MAKRPWYKPEPTGDTAEPVVPAAKKRRGRRRASAVEGPEPVDVHVGARVKLRRTLMGLSQGKLGEAIGLTFQQVQKYELGRNRISASMLHRIAEALDVPVSFFFDDMPDDIRGPRPSGQTDDILGRRESLELLRNYYLIPDGLRRPVHQLVRAMAESGTGTDEE
jgi:transcriptional regulator with XRE-family HTH domain